ncbi:MAG: Glutamyl-tRNA reductase [Cenarchaeum symbiont of Oopsacas minuta]|nr:Glutamyl-tRNA reductase [Cenarchaeum symbiont of Oopsacas minuta]
MNNVALVNARVTFRRSPIHVLEKFMFKNTEIALVEFKRRSGFEECVIVQTCNRVEVYGTVTDLDYKKISNTWAELAGIDDNTISRNIEFSLGCEVTSHLLHLTSGLESMVIGEEQILGQIRGSISAAKEAGSSGRRLDALFDRSVRAGARIRKSTGLGRGGTSVGSMAVKLAEENVEDIKTKRILLIGTGEISSLVAKSLIRRGYEFSVASRTHERSKSFCETMGGGSAIKFEDAFERFGEYDVMFVATSAPYFLVTHEKIATAKENGSKGIMILDLSNPRTVDERVATLNGIKLMNLDQIAEMVDKNARKKEAKLREIKNIISEEIPIIEMSMNRLDAEPIVSNIFKSIESRRQKELQKALRILGEMDVEKTKVIDDLTKAIVESTISTPMNNLRKASEEGKTNVLDAASRLFDYDDSN